MADVRVQVPAAVKRGEAFEVKILIRHPMETGYRVTDDGRPIRRNVITRLTCTYGGRTAFRADPGPGIAANPLFTFWVTAREPGELVFEWIDDAGVQGGERAALNVSG